MIKGYKKQSLIENISPNCNLYKVTEKQNIYFMYEFNQMNQSDQYNFKMIQKLATCVYVLGLIQRFEQKNKTYFITKYADSDLLLLQFQQPNQIFDTFTALKYFMKIIQIIEEIHDYRIIFRNLRLENIKVSHNELFLADMTLSQNVRRKQRYFEVIGVSNFLAPEFFSEDGYGYQIDIWAAGVCLFFMLTGQYPFNMNNKTEQQMKEQISKKCKKGYKFQERITEVKKYKFVETSKDLQNLFKKLFEIDYTERITISEIKKHPALKQINKSQQILSHENMMSIIIQNKNEEFQSLFLSTLKEFPSHYQFHKEETILNFMQASSELAMLDIVEQIPEKIRVLVNFSILKIALLKVTHLQQILYGKRDPEFKIDPKEWEQMRKATAFAKVRQKIEKKKKIIEMLFRASLLNVQNFVEKSSFYSQSIPQKFNDIKHEYRKNINTMYEMVKQTMKKKENKVLLRKSCEIIVRLTILCLVNRIFEQSRLKENFEIYFKWVKHESLEKLQQWIQNQKITHLKHFVKTITNFYMQ